MQLLKNRRQIDFHFLMQLGKIAFEDVDRLLLLADCENTRIPSFMQDEVCRGKGVSGGPSGPSRKGPGVGHKIVSDTEQMIKKKKKNEWEKGKMCKEKKWKKEREKNGQK